MTEGRTGLDWTLADGFAGACVAENGNISPNTATITGTVLPSSELIGYTNSITFVFRALINLYECKEMEIEK